MASIVGFPDPVNEVSARVVAAGVLVRSLATIVLDQPWLTAVIAYGFVARLLTGPTLSPLGHLAARVVTPLGIGVAGHATRRLVTRPDPCSRLLPGGRPGSPCPSTPPTGDSG